MTVKSVLIVSDFACINGGQAKVAIDSARLLADAGLAVTFLAAVGPVDPLLDHPGITVDFIGQHDILSDPSRMRAMIGGIWNRTARARLDRAIARLDPATSILHCHGYAKALSPAIGPVLADGPLPAVYTMHEYFLACPNGGFYDYQANAICTRRAMGADCLTTNCDVRSMSHKAWRVARQAATWSAGRMPRGLRDVITISATQRRVMEPYLAPATRIHHVPNPVDLGALPPVDAGANTIFLFIGRLNPEKGGLLFARAAREAGVQAVFVGDGPEAEAIRTANPDATITGWQTPAQVQDWIARARALVFPSLWYEGQPLVPLEALSRGVPVVAGAWTAASEAFVPGVSGVLIESPTHSALVSALASVQSLDAFDGSRIAETVSPERHLDNLISVYTAIRSARIR